MGGCPGSSNGDTAHCTRARTEWCRSIHPLNESCSQRLRRSTEASWRDEQIIFGPACLTIAPSYVRQLRKSLNLVAASRVSTWLPLDIGIPQSRRTRETLTGFSTDPMPEVPPRVGLVHELSSAHSADVCTKRISRSVVQHTEKYSDKSGMRAQRHYETHNGHSGCFVSLFLTTTALSCHEHSTFRIATHDSDLIVRGAVIIGTNKQPKCSVRRMGLCHAIARAHLHVVVVMPICQGPRH